MGEKIIQQTFWEKTKRFFEPVKYNKIDTIKLLLYFFFEFFVGILIIFFIRDITLILENNQRDIFYTMLWNYVLYFGILFFILMFTKNWWTYSYNRYRKYVEEVYMPSYITLDSNILETVGTGKSVAIISKGIKVWGSLLDNSMIEIQKFILSFCITLYFLLQIHNLLGVLLIILLFLGQLLGVYTNMLVSNIRKNRIELDNIWSRRLVKIIMAKTEILQSQKIKEEVDALHELHEGQIYWNRKMATFLVPFFSIGNIIVLAILFVIFFYFGDLYFAGDFQLATLTALTGAILMMQKDFIGLLGFIKNFGRDFAEIENMWNFFDRTPQIQGYEEGNTFQHKIGAISLKNVSYGYNENKPVFKDFSLNIAGQKVTALVGASGGGKSTLVKLISGYIRQDSGGILVDDQSLKVTSLKSYYADVGYLTQEPSVFDGSVRENLMYAVSSLSGEANEESHITGHPQGEPLRDEKICRDAPCGYPDLDHIIKLANCEFIYDLPNGLDTEIGERGVKLSGGQKQRLAIAKIFLKDPKIIILDEPTSALDSLSEQKITKAMHNLFENRTVLVIAHRLQTVKHADDIIVIEGGEVRERGTHSELTKKKGFYKQMLDLQSGF